MSMFVRSKRLYYTPDNHRGVNELMGNFSQQYPQVEVLGKKNTHEVSLDYEANLFNTWASVEFDLSSEQVESDLLITSTSYQTVVNYEIRMCPSDMVLISIAIKEY